MRYSGKWALGQKMPSWKSSNGSSTSPVHGYNPTVGDKTVKVIPWNNSIRDLEGLGPLKLLNIGVLTNSCG